MESWVCFSFLSLSLVQYRLLMQLTVLREATSFSWRVSCPWGRAEHFNLSRQFSVLTRSPHVGVCSSFSCPRFEHGSSLGSWNIFTLSIAASVPSSFPFNWAKHTNFRWRLLVSISLPPCASCLRFLDGCASVAVVTFASFQQSPAVCNELLSTAFIKQLDFVWRFLKGQFSLADDSLSGCLRDTWFSCTPDFFDWIATPSFDDFKIWDAAVSDHLFDRQSIVYSSVSVKRGCLGLESTNSSEPSRTNP